DLLTEGIIEVFGELLGDFFVLGTEGLPIILCKIPSETAQRCHTHEQQHNTKRYGRSQSRSLESLEPTGKQESDSQHAFQYSKEYGDQIGGLGWPPEASISMTNEPESEDVMKKMATNRMATIEKMPPNGKSLRTSNNAASTTTPSCVSTKSAAPKNCRYRPA